MNAHFRIGRKYKFTEPNLFAPVASRQALEYVGYDKEEKYYLFKATNPITGNRYSQMLSREWISTPRIIREAQEVK